MGGGARFSDFFKKNPNLKYIFLGGGGEGGGVMGGGVVWLW